MKIQVGLSFILAQGLAASCNGVALRGLPAQNATHSRQDVNNTILVNQTETSATQVAETEGELFEGDILLTYETMSSAYGKQAASRAFDVEMELDEQSDTVNSDDYMWKERMDGKVLVPFLFASESTFSEGEKNTIRAALRDLESKTGVLSFQERSDKVDHVQIHSTDGCSSYVGRQGGAQELHLGPGCVHTGIVQHEFMHALGFWHEQSRADRDNFVSINWENIKEGYERNFEKRTDARDLGVGYDYKSVMHYGPTAFSKNGAHTINGFGNSIGQRDGASENDIEQIRLMYRCPTGRRTNSDECSTDCPCGAGEGECESDSECEGSLSCTNRVCAVGPEWSGLLMVDRDERCLDFHPTNKNIYMFRCHGNANQRFVLKSNGEIKTQHSDLCLDFHPETYNVYMYPCHGGNNQKWYIQGSTIRSRHDGGRTCLDMDLSNGNVYMHPCHGNWNQNWHKVNLGPVTIGEFGYKDYCLDVHPENKNMYMYPCHGGSNQQFYITPGGLLKSLLSDELCGDYNYYNGNVYMYRCHRAANQLWYYSGRNLKTRFDDKLCLDMNFNDKNIYMFPCHNGRNQQFLGP